MNRALALGADPARVYFSRGHVYYYANKYDDALQDFGKVALAKEASDGKDFATIWYLLALGHAGKPLAQELKERLAAEAQGAWPRPVFGLLVGTSTPDAVLAEVERMQGDERLLAQCEADFYIGQYYLLQNDRTKAREFFEKAKATQVLVYIEYTLAGLELERLEKQQPGH